MRAYSRRYIFRVGTAKLRAFRVSVSEYWRHSETTYEELRSQSGTLWAPPGQFVDRSEGRNGKTLGQFRKHVKARMCAYIASSQVVVFEFVSIVDR